ncbi:MAG: glutamate--tRNA ligase [Bacillota bacterium]|nr:glutamate--tRNA ligase [Bacillota bacterium]
MASEVRVRFAPSPTGYLHIGGARTAFFNWLFARHNGGKFVLRIEDTDAERTIEDSITQMLEAFKWLGLDWDEGPVVGGEYGPYFQSQRRDLYKASADKLLAGGHAYWCYCTPEELKARREGAVKEGRAPMYEGACRNLTEAQIQACEREGRKPALRLRTPDHGITAYDDLIRGRIEFENALIGDFVLLKSDGYPTYNYACVVDDSAMHLTYIIRADEHISNTPKQIMVYEALGLEQPRFAHVPMILAPDRSKLSKRHGAMSVQEFKDLGFMPEAVMNYLAFLGWTPNTGSEVLTVDEMVRLFRLEDVSKNPAIYDLQKLTWMNGHYLRNTDLGRVISLAVPFMQKAALFGDVVSEQEIMCLRSILSAMRDRVKTLVEIPEAVEYFYRDLDGYDDKGRRKHFSDPSVARLLEDAASALEAVEGDFTPVTVEAVYRKIIEERGITSGQLIHPTRLAVTGRTLGPGLFDVLALLGKERSVERMRRAAWEIRKAGPAGLAGG